MVLFGMSREPTGPDPERILRKLLCLGKTLDEVELWLDARCEPAPFPLLARASALLTPENLDGRIAREESPA